jgi:putative restriction endonuclease
MDLFSRYFEKINVWKQGGQRAPHKPLLVLYALGRCYRKEDRMVAYSVADKDLRQLLIEFGPTRKSYHPEYPFWRLQNDGCWELHGAEKVEARKSNTDAKKSELLRYNVHGGFIEEIYSQLYEDYKTLFDIAMRLLEANFPSSVHEDLLQTVGLDVENKDYNRKKRDPHFRERILRAYEYRCAICGFDVRIGDSLVGLEAAHIKWFQAGGPDIESNGVALCSLHHKLFDRGVFSITDSMCIQVSERAHGKRGFEEWLKIFHGEKINFPQRPSYFPEEKYLHWHVREVFKGPSRYLSLNSVDEY